MHVDHYSSTISCLPEVLLNIFYDIKKRDEDPGAVVIHPDYKQILSEILDTTGDGCFTGVPIVYSDILVKWKENVIVLAGGFDGHYSIAYVQI